MLPYQVHKDPMRFRNKGPNRQIRIGSSDDCKWIGLDEGQEIDLPASVGRKHGLEEVTEGKIGETKVETKQLEPIKKNEEFSKKLREIDGIGKKTAEDIIKVYPTEEQMINAIKSKEHLPFRDDVVEKLNKWQAH